MNPRQNAVIFGLALLTFCIGLSLAWFPLGFIGGGLVGMLIILFDPADFRRNI